ncbi:enoyl-CoA hydratase-related protein [Saccharopolyspora hattusasensis]|uniref:enoyl-CoA hydratase-related protein n=1 Tax=Saccharopolyspora hattusasensis TaxID=1128679 RepID=UPI003D98FB6D
MAGPGRRGVSCGELNGNSAGLGLAIAPHDDVRFVATEAKLTTAFVKRGLIGEHGISWLLPRIVGRGRALDLLLSARVITGTEAADYGLAQFVGPRADLLETTISYAHEMARNCSPHAMAALKRQMIEDEHRTPLDALLAADQATRESFTWCPSGREW